MVKMDCRVCGKRTLIGCCGVPYCNVHCQARDWKSHQKTHQRNVLIEGNGKRTRKNIVQSTIVPFEPFFKITWEDLQRQIVFYPSPDTDPTYISSDRYTTLWKYLENIQSIYGWETIPRVGLVHRAAYRENENPGDAIYEKSKTVKYVIWYDYPNRSRGRFSNPTEQKQATVPSEENIVKAEIDVVKGATKSQDFTVEITKENPEEIINWQIMQDNPYDYSISSDFGNKWFLYKVPEWQTALRLTFEEYDMAISRGHLIVVGCVSCQNRSAAVLLLYLLYHGINLEIAYNMLFSINLATREYFNGKIIHQLFISDIDKPLHQRDIIIAIKEVARALFVKYRD